MSLLEQYEQQYSALIAEITINIGQLKTLSGAEHRVLSSSIDSSLAEAYELLEQMGLEIRDLNIAQRPSFSSKLNCAQVELQRLQVDYRNAKDERGRNAENQRNIIIDLGASGDGGDTYEDEDVPIYHDQRQRLLENSERIERTGNKLIEGYRLTVETEAIGTQVLNDLHHQGEILQSARSRLRETNAELGRASRTLNNMMMRALREKALLYAVGFCFVVAVGISLYLTFSSAPTS